MGLSIAPMWFDPLRPTAELLGTALREDAEEAFIEENGVFEDRGNVDRTFLLGCTLGDILM
jgi:hypothetical protein